MENNEYFKKYIASVLNFPKEGINFKDVTPTLEDADAYQSAIDAMAEKIEKYDFDKIICADARGFLFGAPLAYKMHKGLVIARKPNKLPRPGSQFSYSLEYGKNVLVISEGSVKPGDKFCVIDDLLATGGSANAMVQLVKENQGEVMAACFYVELSKLGGANFMREKCPGLDIYTIIDFPDVD